MYATRNDVREMKTVYNMEFKRGGSNLNPAPSSAGEGRMMLKIVMSPMKTGRGTAPTSVGLQPEGRVPAG